MTAVRAAVPELAEQAAEAHDPAEQSWSADQMLLAALIDSVRQLGWMFAVVNFKSAPQTPPEPIPRPGVTSGGRKRGMTVEAYRRMTGQEPPLYLIQGTG